MNLALLSKFWPTYVLRLEPAAELWAVPGRSFRLGVVELFYQPLRSEAHKVCRETAELFLQTKAWSGSNFQVPHGESAYSLLIARFNRLASIVGVAASDMILI